MSSVGRRLFLFSLGAGLAAPAIVRARGQKARLPISFSTLGCPDWTWKQVLAQADGLGYGGIEIRGLEGEMDLTKWPGFQGHRLEESRADLAARGTPNPGSAPARRLPRRGLASRSLLARALLSRRLARRLTLLGRALAGGLLGLHRLLEPPQQVRRVLSDLRFEALPARIALGARLVGAQGLAA